MFRLFILIFLICSTARAEKPVHLFILSGQSNMAGMKPETGLLPEARRLFSDGEVVYIKIAKGGEPIRYWVRNWNQLAAKHRLKPRINATRYYEPIVAEYKRKLEKHKRFASITFCWMQGERDAREKLGAAYKDAFNQLVTDLRKDLKRSDMAVVIGRISDYNGRSYPDWETVRQIQVKLAQSDKHGGWVDTDDLNDKSEGNRRWNDLHYTKEGYSMFGQRLARQAKRIFDGRKPEPNGRP